MRPARARIDLAALVHNYRLARTLGGSRALAVIKADAYGHGAVQCARALDDLADGFGVAAIEEAVELREAGIRAPILLLEGFFEPCDLALLQAHRLTAVLHSQAQLDMLQTGAASMQSLPVWIKLNTGMNRLGFAPDEFVPVFERVRQMQALGKVAYQGAMTHFARADDSLEFTHAQLACFQQTVKQSTGAVSVCNSAASLLPDCWTALPAGQEQWVRIGICLYGASPFVDRCAASIGLLPAMTLRSEIIGVQRVRTGEGIGYGHLFTANKEMRIGIVACGYADGYPRHAPNGTPIYVAGVRTRLLGRVSMDMLMVDLTHVPQAGVGSPVTLWGADGPGVDEVAQACGTIAYELLCAVAPRVPRVIQNL